MKQRLGLFDATAINVGAIIGGGIFVVTGIVAGLAGSALVVSMLLAAVTSLFTALSYAELTAWLPKEGSVYEYGYRLISPAAGFLGGWMWILSNIFSGAAVALGFGNYLSALVPGLSPGVVAAIVSVAFTALNYFGIQHSAGLNNLLVVAKLLILGFFVAFGLLFVKVGNFQPFNPLGTGVLYGAFYIFFAYGGFARVAVVAEEIKDAKRVIPRAIVLSLIISTIFYIAVGLVAVGLVGAGSLSGSGHPLALAIGATGSEAAVLLVSVGGVISTASVLLTSILGVSRLGFAMSRRGDFPAPLSRLHPRFGTPSVSVVASGALMTCLALFVDLGNVIAISTFAMLFYYGVGNIAATRLPKEERKYPTYVSLLGTISCFVFLIFALFLSPQAWAAGLTGLGVGAAYFLALRWRRKRKTT
ncbi:MAG: amino acid permease [Candidatus Bathyarchaeota archaeon]|nr:amino acid permease [Candidatus Bathyarchaeota archaeon]